ncbi:transporter [Sphingomonas sp. MAH-20]|uniref:Transporter n=1 Tax=Sphingomonas horti TaxID=2682842 RepID=A0A6I4J3D7_9SPHN|nr:MULTISPECIES: transporter [Sphingomonas]MBA2918582.1 transporter [Sphingomonas sp. CGMCC 1.13658]MVO78613.1 transporter [Sphingomonas horti]
MIVASAGRRVRHLILAAALLSGPALAEERALCPDRPGLNAPPCIVDAGHVLVELGAADWTLERHGRERVDTLVSGDLAVRVGLAERMEVQLGWTAYGHVRNRDASGRVTRRSGTGDVALGFKYGLVRPDGEGISIALQPYVTLPTGGEAIGAGTWGAGVLVPLSFDLGHDVALVATPEASAAPDADGSGRHLAWGSAIGIEMPVATAWAISAELQAIRDDDPAGPRTLALGAVSLAWQPGANTQLDIGVVTGLNRASPDLELMAGIARRF